MLSKVRFSVRFVALAALFWATSCGTTTPPAPVEAVDSPAGEITKKAQPEPPVAIRDGDRRIRVDVEEWSIWGEGEDASKKTAQVTPYQDPAASGKQAARVVFQEVDTDTDRGTVTYRFYIVSTFFRLNHDVWVRYATKDMGIECEFIYQEGNKFEGPKDPLTIRRLAMKPTANWRGTYRWEKLGTIRTTRGWHELVVKSTGGAINIDALVFATHSAYVEDGRADRDIADKNAGIYTAGGVALGGIGVGKFELCRDGKVRNLVTNNNWDAPLNELNGSFFAAWAKPTGKGETPIHRALVLRSEYAFEPVKSIDYDGVFPTAAMGFRDPALPVSIQLNAFSPLLPNNVKDSSLPVALYEFTLENPTDREQEAAIAFSWENIVGLGAWGDPRWYHYWDDRQANTQRFAQDDGMKGIIFKNKKTRTPLSDGDYTLACVEQEGVQVSYRLQWDTRSDGLDDWSAFREAGRFKDGREVASGSPGAAVLAATTTLKPGEKKTIRYILAWDMPNLISAKGRPYGHAHNNFFTGSWAVANYARQSFDRLQAGTYQIQKHLKASNLPPWFVRRLLNDAVPIYANSWLTKDYKFAINESPNNMNGCMGTMDQRFVAGIFNAMFYTDLDRSELNQFADSQSKTSGSVPHDLGHSDLDTNKNRTGGGPGDWPDLALSFVLQNYRRYLWTGDQEFIDRVYPKMKKSMNYTQEVLDTDGDGIPNVRGGLLGCSYDAQLTYGNVDYIGSMALAALLAMEDLSMRMGEPEYAKQCRSWFEKGRASFERELWTGEYFRHYVEIEPRIKDGKAQPLEVSDNCHLAQLAGQWFADAVGLGAIQDPDKIHKAVGTMARLNGNPKWWCPPDEVDAKGNIEFAHTVSWVLYIEAFFSALAFQHGHPDDGFRIAEAIHKTIEKEGNNPYDIRLMYHPDDGGMAWGRWYMTAPASWTILNALEGLTVDIPRKQLGLAPSLPGSFGGKLSAPLFSPVFWAWLDYVETHQEKRTERTYQIKWLEGSPSGNVAFDTLALALPRSATQIRVEVNDKEVSSIQFDKTTGKLVVVHQFEVRKGTPTGVRVLFVPSLPK